MNITNYRIKQYNSTHKTVINENYTSNSVLDKIRERDRNRGAHRTVQVLSELRCKDAGGERLWLKFQRMKRLLKK